MQGTIGIVTALYSQKLLRGVLTKKVFEPDVYFRHGPEVPRGGCHLVPFYQQGYIAENPPCLVNDNHPTCTLCNLRPPCISSLIHARSRNNCLRSPTTTQAASSTFCIWKRGKLSFEINFISTVAKRWEATVLANQNETAPSLAIGSCARMTKAAYS
ncbi:uncharacterized protein BCR38DRAFT_27563 [Pseudomassariella vexata]|uniref:Uncharacterized protein n=1 Tax=Pseudomassariella vexata TaxID=1141098 RepID=A0A1Y2EKR3_9PEZI|nr:uncharacterized protein BCR38DRAFT_27563 [Pseudomassariella vexata]ORY72108.1 hypothetical protein BCR38DRAFT_27563 [Pseudomassariella vexata]